MSNVFDTESHAPLAGPDTRRSVEDFLLLEAELLDDRRWADWLALLSDDFEYVLPMPVTRDNPWLPPYDEDSYLMVENRSTLNAWINRLSPSMIDTAWAENPPARIRHFVSNVRVREGSDPGQVKVRANVLISIARGDEQPVLFSSERHDVLLTSGDSWRIASRKVYLDQNLPTWQMRMIV